ncbi:hypothetical protein KPH14_001752 [Odynerus spinipes]|uniref:Odorant receptor n=1 Tax=Odynerus spinipes TaxID=1348599 RepID=A0AAD9S1K0_9HYME|nr:hypothetical protein KPH14_001752 [Odynerus spinipes]
MLAMFSGLVTVTGILRFCLENIYNLKILTKGLSCLASFSMVALKALMFFLYRQQIRELNFILEPMFEEVLVKAQYQSVVLSILNLFRRPAYMIYYLTVGILMLYTCSPLILILYQVIKHVDPIRYGLPFPTSLPWIDGTPGVRYKVEYLFEIQVSWFAVFVTCSVDCAYGFYIFQMIGVLRAMSLDCEELARSPKELDVVIRNCVKKQTLLLRCRDIIQNVYGPVILGLIISGSAVLCALIFQMFETEISVGKTLLFLVYGMMKMTQVFLYSWHGSIFAAESEAFRRSIYCGEWYQHGDIILMKDVLFVLTQKPIVLTACHFVYVSLDIFVKILNTSMSCYFLLQTFDEIDKH